MRGVFELGLLWFYPILIFNKSGDFQSIFDHFVPAKNHYDSGAAFTVAVSYIHSRYIDPKCVEFGTVIGLLFFTVFFFSFDQKRRMPNIYSDHPHIYVIAHVFNKMLQYLTTCM